MAEHGFMWYLLAGEISVVPRYHIKPRFFTAFRNRDKRREKITNLLDKSAGVCYNEVTKFPREGKE